MRASPKKWQGSSKTGTEFSCQHDRWKVVLTPSCAASAVKGCFATLIMQGLDDLGLGQDARPSL